VQRLAGVLHWLSKCPLLTPTTCLRCMCCAVEGSKLHTKVMRTLARIGIRI